LRHSQNAPSYSSHTFLTTLFPVPSLVHILSSAIYDQIPPNSDFQKEQDTKPAVKSVKELVN